MADSSVRVVDLDFRQGQLADMITDAIESASLQTAEHPDGEVKIDPHPGLIGFPKDLYVRIGTALKTKRHLLFYGPPGTGKTTLAEWVAGQLRADYKMFTASSDWASQDVIGGYMPSGSTGVEFTTGFLLEYFDRPIVIDELNRADIDKALGPLFTVLSGHPVTLPYLVDMDNPEAGRHEIRFKPAADGTPNAGVAHVPGEDWRLLATINSLDKASLYQMSYALSRRFAWIYVGNPTNIDKFLRDYLESEGITVEPSGELPLAGVWKAVNKAREIGAAPILDIVAYLEEALEEPNYTANGLVDLKAEYVFAVSAYVMPMLDGISITAGIVLRQDLESVLELTDLSDEAKAIAASINEICV